MADERDDVRSRIDIVDLVRREVPLKQKGKHWTGICPFHSDKNPSFFVTSETGRYKCWSCQASGDIFDWVMKRRNVDFAEALQMLAQEAGVALKRGGGIPSTARQTLGAAMDHALDFFRLELKRSQLALDYCRDRGLGTETLDHWQIGFAPEFGEALPNYLKRKEVSLADAKSLFLVDEDARGGFYAKFRRRLMFPIRDEKGALVAFGGRILGEGQPKYINSSDTPLYRKSRVLYGMNWARDEMVQSRRAVLVEGYLDVIACHESGVTTALASLGTSLAEDHAKLLKRWCDEVVILYDSDRAGQNAAGRAIDILATEGLRVRIALMPEGEDPDTLLKKNGASAVQNAVAGGLSPTDYRLQALERHLSPERDDFWSEATTILAEESNELEIVRNLDRLAGMYPGSRDLQLNKGALRSMIARARRTLAQNKKILSAPEQAKPENSSFKAETPKVSPVYQASLGKLKAAEVVIFLAFLGSEFRRYGWMLASKTDLFETGIARLMSESVRAAFSTGPPEGASSEWLNRIQDPAVRVAFADLVFDPRGDNLNEQFVMDSVNLLQQGMARRNLQIKKSTGAELSEIDELLRLMNPDTSIKVRVQDDFY